jgi:UDP-3-O-[3-hydroxymyristoyl] glucosamine N-acyltransferase
MTLQLPLDVVAIQQLLPHRYPFLLVDRVVITAMSLVTHSIREPGEYSSGTPIMENRAWRRSAARFKQLDSIVRRLPAADKD